MQKNLLLLESQNWLDRHTRGVFLEFTVYNPHVGLLLFFAVNACKLWPLVGESICHSNIGGRATSDSWNIYSSSGGANESSGVLWPWRRVSAHL